MISFAYAEYTTQQNYYRSKVVIVQANPCATNLYPGTVTLTHIRYSCTYTYPGTVTLTYIRVQFRGLFCYQRFAGHKETASQH